MSKMKLNLIYGINPEYGLKYIHLTQEEIIYITEQNGCYTKSRYVKIKDFISRNKDLRKLEDELKEVSKLNAREHGPYSYLLNLVLYGRINVSFEIIRKLISKCLNEVCYAGSPFVDISFINDFKNKCIDLKYSDGVIENNIREIVTIFLFFKGISKKIPYMFRRYIEISDEKIIRVRMVRPTLYTVLINMGYELEKCGFELNPCTKRQYESINMRKEFMEGLNEYLEEYGNKISSRTLKVNRSHLMVFLNYIADNFSYIKSIEGITNKHIVSFIEYQRNTKNIRGDINSLGTINNRLEAVENLWNYFIEESKYKVSMNIVTIYDKVKETKKHAKYIKKDDYNKLIEALKNITSEEYLQLRIIIVILLSTGRRINEVLALQYDCLNPINGKTNIYFHALKHDKPPINRPISESCKILVLKAKKIAKKYTIALECKKDNLVVKRLFPSIDRKGMTLLSDTTVRKLFYKFQIENGIINEKGKPVFKIHDIKDTFVSNMLALGYSVIEISKFLQQNIESLIPYEANNEMAMKTLKLAEEKGLLIGSSFSKEEITDIDNNKIKSKIISILKDTDVVSRHKENLIYKISNKSEVMPLALGECTDISSITECGPLVCLTCNEILPEDINVVESYFLKLYKHIYTNKRKQEIKGIEKQLNNAYCNIYINKEKMSEKEMKKRINLIKKKAREEI